MVSFAEDVQHLAKEMLVVSANACHDLTAAEELFKIKAYAADLRLQYDRVR
jgi:hypothetical protein